jgi:hypothetical protein
MMSYSGWLKNLRTITIRTHSINRNIHGISNNVLGEKTKDKDFTDHINNIDFIFLLKLGVTLILMFLVSGLLPLILHTNQICCKLGGITLPTKIKF